MIAIYLLIFFVALCISLFLTPVVLRLAVRFHMLDVPGEKKIHIRPTPLIGGIAIYAAFFISTALAFILSRGRLLGEYDTHYAGLVLGGTIILLLGIYDDKKGAKAPFKLTVQTAAAVILILFGYSIHVLTNPFGNGIEIGLWGIPFIILWVVGLTNAMNLIDGLDGLACGVAGIAALTLFFSGYNGPPFVPTIAIALAGATVGFLRYNYYPARIFLGDTGSLFLGFVLAALSIQGSFKTAAGTALIIPLLALLVPLMDTSASFFRRIVRRQHPFQADRKHLHDWLMNLGYSQKQVVLMIYLLAVNLGAIALIMQYASRRLALILLFLIGVMLLIVFKILEDFKRSLIDRQ